MVAIVTGPGCSIDRDGRLRTPLDGGLPDGGPRDVHIPDVGPRDAGPGDDAGPCEPSVIGTPCDGDDVDLCEDDEFVCVEDRAKCSSGTDEFELCSSGDEDCNPATTDDGDAIDRSTYYRDEDGDRWGDPGAPVLACAAPAGTVNDGMASDCNDADPALHPGALELCNAADEDCDGRIDESEWDLDQCPCRVRERDGHTYLFCISTHRNQNDAETFCAGYGYHLVKIEDMGENDFVQSEADSIEPGPWWTGLEDPTEGTYTWHDGTEASYTRWDTGEPNDNSGADCVTIVSSSGRWRTEPCNDRNAFVCEFP